MSVSVPRWSTGHRHMEPLATVGSISRGHDGRRWNSKEGRRVASDVANHVTRYQKYDPDARVGTTLMFSHFRVLATATSRRRVLRSPRAPTRCLGQLSLKPIPE